MISIELVHEHLFRLSNYLNFKLINLKNMIELENGSEQPKQGGEEVIYS